MHKMHYISPDPLDLVQLERIANNDLQIALSEEANQRIVSCRQYLDRKLSESNEPFYGINTGFGSLCNIRISDEEIEALQNNLVRSHACGFGDLVPIPVIRLMLFLKIQNLAFGNSAVQLSTVQRLIDFFNHGIYPVIYQQGSLGASGDLAPLAHLSLPLLGEGEVYVDGQRQATKSILQEFGWEPLHLKSKEGLALLNGTQFSTAYAWWAVVQAHQLANMADTCTALSLDAFNCRISPFDPRLHAIRPHAGQIAVAAHIRELRNESEIAASPKSSVQDPYAFRCVPQVHGASRDAIAYAEKVVLTEVNAVTDNPNLFPDTDAILSGGNFHAQPIALALDFLGIALAEFGSISERRTYQLISGNRNLPSFLIKDPGLHSGLMIPQYTAASIASQNKQLCSPASVDSIVSSNGQEDHVSMAANAATKTYRIVENVFRILAIEWFTAAQALDFRRPKKTSAVLEDLVKKYREKVPFLQEDRILSVDMHETLEFLRENIR